MYLQKEDASLAEATGVLFELNDDLYQMTFNTYSGILRDELIKRWTKFPKNLALGSFFVPRYKHLKHCDTELKASILASIKLEYEGLIVPTTTSITTVGVSVKERKRQRLHLDSNPTIANEIDLYLNDYYIDGSSLDFWKENERKYPILAKLACKYLFDIASSAPSERLFSDAKNIELKKRYNMLGDTLSCYVKVRSGLKSERMHFKMN